MEKKRQFQEIKLNKNLTTGIKRTAKKKKKEKNPKIKIN